MTEAEWIGSPDPSEMLDFLKVRATGRRLRLIACAFARHVWKSLEDERSRRAVVVAELFADGLATNAELTIAEAAAQEAVQSLSVELNARHLARCGIDPPRNYFRLFRPGFFDARTDEEKGTLAALECASLAALTSTADSDESADWLAARLGRDKLKQYLLLLGPVWNRYVRKDTVKERNKVIRRLIVEIVGNPFRAPTTDTGWWTTAATVLAQTIYDERRFEDLPVLADALEEAGCSNAEILGHCRNGQEHVRGCWVLDWVLGKE